MPELPEVETIARTLREGGQGRVAIVGHEIAGARLLWQRTLAEPAPELFLACLPGQVVVEVGRRAKFLVIRLSLDTLLVHLRMSGDLRTESAVDERGDAMQPLPHDRLLIDFSNQTRLAFNDTRKFGRVWLAADPGSVLGGLGPEPLEDGFSAEMLYQRLQSTRRQLKPLLLDQTFLAGLGNIYADEALFAAGLHPLRISSTLSQEEAGRLWAGIRAVLAEGIQRNGASIDWAYRGGEFQNHFMAYQRTGLPCYTCGTPIQRITVGQRGTHFCPHCQAAI